eukprot:TRINITY_DN5375_c0_g1_i1.p1 TRINITY_DN5375_c0_g1~~TRINITY_DN5375_c0_g1_i1.p1  ORF type:complete len:240 (-),score=36.78 TRINITY_DN5375_c0_g1_i1:67-786(-)
MSQLNTELLNAAVSKILAYSNTPETKRKFLETVELQVMLKNYDYRVEARFNGKIRLPHVCRPNLKVCVIGDEKHVDEAVAAGFPHIDVEGLKNFQKNKKLIKKWAHKYNVFLASRSLVNQIPRLLGPTLYKMHKFPVAIEFDVPLAAHILDAKATVNFPMRREICLGAAVGNVGMKEEDLVENITTALNFLITLLPKGWLNIRSVHIKSTMGKPHKIIFANFTEPTQKIQKEKEISSKS